MIFLPDSRAASSFAGYDARQGVSRSFWPRRTASGPLIVETYHLAGLDLQRTPVSRTCIIGSQPFRRRIIVIPVERIAPLGVAGLVGGEEVPAAFQRAPDRCQNIGEFVPRNMQQAGIGPDRVIALDLVEVVKQQRLDGTAEPLRCDIGHFRRPVGGPYIKPLRQHFRGVAAGAASEFEDASARRQQRQKRHQPRLARGDLAPGIGFGMAAVELQRRFVHPALPRGNAGSAICRPRPSISRMFCTAAPDAPLPRLSSRATSTAWRCLSLANT